MTDSPFDGVPEDSWADATNRLIDEHPLDRQTLVEVVLGCWEDIFESEFGRRKLHIGTDIFPTPQIMATLLHELIPAELHHRDPKLWRRDKSGEDKDLVYLPDPRFSVEIKCSSSKADIFGNRSYAQQHSEGKKTRAGYFLGVNFGKFTEGGERPAITRVAFGWLDWSDWIGQKAATGQQARLTPAAKKGKMLPLWSGKD